jgi:hypothetical protein
MSIFFLKKSLKGRDHSEDLSIDFNIKMNLTQIGLKGGD